MCLENSATKNLQGETPLFHLFPLRCSISNIFGLQQIPNETKWRVFARYVRDYDQSAKLHLAQLALNQQNYGQAAELYVEMLNDASHVTTITSRHDLWLQLFQICTNHPQTTSSTMIGIPGTICTALHYQNNNQYGNKNQTTCNHQTSREIKSVNGKDFMESTSSI